MGNRGFTLLELMVVIIILGVLAALISGNFFTSLQKGRDARRKADLEQIQRALELYYEDKKVYPNFDIFATANLKLCETKIAASCGSEKVYMQNIPNDPTSGKTYKYVNSTTQSYGLYACMENTLQILPYISTNFGSFSCTTQCKKQDGTPTTTGCIWGISDSNSLP